MLKNIGIPEVLIIGAILFVLFGGKKLTDMARGVGESTRELKKAKKEFQEALKDEADDLKDLKQNGLGGGK